MDDDTKALIKKKANEIRAGLCPESHRGIASFFGYPLDMDDPDAVLVAACAKLEQDIRAEYSRFTVINTLVEGR